MTTACSAFVSIENDFVEIMDAMYQQEDARSPARGPWIAQSKLMQLDFIYAIFDQMTAQERREFWTDMTFLSLTQIKLITKYILEQIHG